MRRGGDEAPPAPVRDPALFFGPRHSAGECRQAYVHQTDTSGFERYVKTGVNGPGSCVCLWSRAQMITDGTPSYLRFYLRVVYFLLLTFILYILKASVYIYIHFSVYRKTFWRHWSHGYRPCDRSCFSTWGNYIQPRINLFTQNRFLGPTHTGKTVP